MIYITVLFTLIASFLIIMFFTYFFKSSYYHNRYSETLYTLKEKGYLISISGKVKVGKTTLANGMKHAYEKIILNQLEEKIAYTKVILQDVDFNELNDFIDFKFYEWFDQDLKKDFNQLAEEVIVTFKINDSVVNDFINIKRIIVIVRQYVEAYFYYFIKANFVYSNTSTYSRVTGKFNQKYNIENQQIMNSYLRKTFDIDRYSVELIDEASDEDNAMKWREIEDTGAKEYRRKYAHIYEETNRLISIKQDSSDEIKKYRNLYHSNFYINHKAVLRNTYGLIKRILFILINLKIWFYNKWFSLLHKTKLLFKRIDSIDVQMEFEYNRSNFIRKMDTRKYYLEMLFKSFGYLVFNTNDYYNEKDIGSKQADTFAEEILVFPVIECWGMFNHVEFNYLYDELKASSEKEPTIANYYYHNNYFEKKVGDNNDGNNDFSFD